MNVESGYHDLIEENISHWWAVEEDIIDSYTTSDKLEDIIVKRVRMLNNVKSTLMVVE